jgi:hypothetical protein
MTTSTKTDQNRKLRSYCPTSARAVEVACDEHFLIVTFEDGRVLHAPLEWFPRLRSATAAQRQQGEIGGGGVSLHWPEIDEDLSVANLLAGGDGEST